MAQCPSQIVLPAFPLQMEGLRCKDQTSCCQRSTLGLGQPGRGCIQVFRSDTASLLCFWTWRCFRRGGGDFTGGNANGSLLSH